MSRLQREREKALRDFCTKECEVLIATDVAASGLDIPNVKLVVNYDLPTEIEEYVRRRFARIRFCIRYC